MEEKKQGCDKVAVMEGIKLFQGPQFCTMSEKCSPPWYILKS